METFLFILAIVLPLCLLIAVFRLNTLLSNIQWDTDAPFLNDKALLLLNNGGKWLTLLAGVTTFPLVMGLIFDADNSVRWIVNLGVTGCLAMVAAAILLLPALLGFGISRHIQVKLLVNAIGRVLLKNVRQLIRNKVVLWWFAGILLTLLFFPSIKDVLIGIVYIIWIIVAGRLGLLDNVELHKDDEDGLVYNYATGKWDHGYSMGGRYNYDE